MIEKSLMMITTPPNEATKIARDLVKLKLAACVQISAPVSSVYEWKGNMEVERECQLFLKTTKQQMQGIQTYLKENHPYDVPELIEVDISGGSPEYLKWIEESLEGKEHDR